MDEVAITIIGAGVIGLSIAAELSQKYDNIIVLEKHNTFGQEISSRNSEVLHAGIYYPEGSLKAKLCIEGIEYLYEICNKYSIPHKRIGKLIVATNESELVSLEEIYDKGVRNCAKDLKLIDKNDIQKIERNTNAIAAIYSPNTGIIDSHSLMKHFYDKSEENGVLISYNSEVELIHKENNGYVIGIKQDNYRFKSRIVINCAGLSADYLAELTGIDIDESGYRIKPCKGSYFSYSKPSPVKTLVYPVPDERLTGLGIHATLDLGSRLRFGPDTEYVESIDYNVDIHKRKPFYESAAKIIPGLEMDAFVPDMAGIRPKLQVRNGKIKDFVIREETNKGLHGLINLIGIESPGLTAASAIGKLVVSIMSQTLD